MKQSCFKKNVFANSKNEGGYFNKNAFTLIELLAIIVILAIIAVITVPIILNIIENSKKGAVIDSAYGFKDAVGKFYLSKAIGEDIDEVLDDEVIKEVSELESDGMTVSGKKPSAGWVRISKGQVIDFSLVFDDYTVSFDNATNSLVSTKNGQLKTKPLLVDTCPGPNCYYGTSNATIGGDLPTDYSDDYSNIYTEFLAHILDSNTGKISRSFVCGNNEGNYFCIEGKDTSKFNSNSKIVNDIYTSTSCGPHQIYTSVPPYQLVPTEDIWCSGSSSNALVGKNGNVQTVSGFFFCEVDQNGNSQCSSV